MGWVPFGHNVHQQQSTCCFYLFHSGRVKWKNAIHWKKILFFPFWLTCIKNLNPEWYPCIITTFGLLFLFCIFKKPKAVSIYGLQQPEGLFWERKNFLPGTVSMYGIGHSKYCCQKEKYFFFPFSLCRNSFWTPEYPISVNPPSPFYRWRE